MPAITLEQAVRNGISTERAAETFYRSLAEGTEDKLAKAFLTEMADQESEHCRRIESFGHSFEAGELPVLATNDVELVETAPAWAGVDNMRYEEALALALENENHAVLYYAALREASSGAVASFFDALRREEESHVVLLVDRLRNP